MGGTDHHAGCLANMPEKQAAALNVAESLELRIRFLENALDTELSLESPRREDNGAQWPYDKDIELPGVAEAQSIFEEGCPGDQLTLQPHEHAQELLSTVPGGLELPSAEARRMSASIGNKA